LASDLPDLIEHNVLVTEDAASARVFELDIDNGQVPHIGFRGLGLPLFSPTGHNAWALLNLILCLIGILYVVVTTVRVVLLKKRVQTEEEKKYYVASNPSETECPDEEDEKDKRYRPGWLAAAAVLAIASAYLFALTQDMRNPIVLIDGWTLAHAIIMAAQFIAVNVVFKSEKREECDEKDANEEPDTGI